MKNSILIVLLLIISSVVHTMSTDPGDFESEQVKPRHGGVIHRFYGPWTTLHKRNGDYVDYNDYGARIPDPSPTLVDVLYDARPTNKIPPIIYTDSLFLLNSDYKWEPVGVADFRTGIRSVTAIADEENNSDKAGEEAASNKGN